jgi:hypothetical protein
MRFRKPLPGKRCQSLGNALIYPSVFVAAETCFNGPAMAVYSDSTIPALRRHVTVLCFSDVTRFLLEHFNGNNFAMHLY